MAKSLRDFLREIREEFSFRNFLLNRLSDFEEGRYVSYYRSVDGRGRDQLKCLIAYIKTWRKTGETSNYCHSCSEFLSMTCMESALGCSEECKKGHYRFEAT